MALNFLKKPITYCILNQLHSSLDLKTYIVILNSYEATLQKDALALEEFKAYSDENKREELIKFSKTVFLEEKRNPKQSDFEKRWKITFSEIEYDLRRIFGNFQGLLLACGLKSNRRKSEMSKEELQEFLKEIKYEDSNKCWIAPDKQPTISYKGSKILIHRLSYLVFNGTLEPGLVVMHLCNNNKCFNPEHLKLGTQKENCKFCVESGRHKNNNSKKINTHNLKDPYDFEALLTLVRSRVILSSKNEWLYIEGSELKYPGIRIEGKRYVLHRLILANKMNKKYEDVDIARHVLPDGSEGQRHDLNPDHLLEGNRRDNANDAKNKWSLKEGDILFIKNSLKEIKYFERGDAKTFDQTMAEKFNVASSIIKLIRLGKIYTCQAQAQEVTAYRGNKEKPVVQLAKDGSLVKIFTSAKRASEELNIIASCITKACKGKSKLYEDFIWIYGEVFKSSSEEDIFNIVKLRTEPAKSRKKGDKANV